MLLVWLEHTSSCGLTVKPSKSAVTFGTHFTGDLLLHKQNANLSLRKYFIFKILAKM